jgi:hypothetical protein
MVSTSCVYTHISSQYDTSTSDRHPSVCVCTHVPLEVCVYTHTLECTKFSTIVYTRYVMSMGPVVIVISAVFASACVRAAGSRLACHLVQMHEGAELNYPCSLASEGGGSAPPSGFCNIITNIVLLVRQTFQRWAIKR